MAALLSSLDLNSIFLQPIVSEYQSPDEDLPTNFSNPVYEAGFGDQFSSNGFGETPRSQPITIHGISTSPNPSPRASTDKGKSSPIFSRMFHSLKPSPKTSPKSSPSGSPKLEEPRKGRQATEKDTAALIDEEEVEF